MNSDNREVIEFAQSVGWILDPKLACNAHLKLTHPKIKHPVFLSLNGCVKKFNKRSLIKAMRDAGIEVKCRKKMQVPTFHDRNPFLGYPKTTNAARRHRKPAARMAMMNYRPAGSYAILGHAVHAPSV